MKNVCIFGYYGKGNLGDEWILSSLLYQLKARLGDDIAVTVFSLNPEQVRASHRVDAIHVDDHETIKATLSQSDLLILGGGGIIHGRGFDPEQVGAQGARGLAYLLWLAKTARAQDVPLWMLGIGVDTWNDTTSAAARELFEMAEHIFVRDSQSVIHALQAAPNLTECIRLGSDFAYTQLPQTQSQSTSQPQDQGKYLLVIIRGMPASRDRLQRLASQIAAAAHHLNLPVHLCSFQSQDLVDEEMMNVLQSSLSNQLDVQTSTVDQIDNDVIDLFDQAAIIINMRFHGALLSLTRSKPTIAIGVHPKLHQLMLEYGMDEYYVSWEHGLERLSEKTIRLHRSLTEQASPTDQSPAIQPWPEHQKRIETICALNTDRVDQMLSCLGPMQAAQATPKLKHQTTPRKLRVLFVGGYWMGRNDIVFLMHEALRDIPYIEVREFCTDDHLWAIHTPKRPYDRGFKGTCTLDEQVLRPVVDEFKPDIVFLVAGGLTLTEHYAKRLRQQCALVGISLSDPDVFEKSVKPVASRFDYFFTNAPDSIPHYRDLGTKVSWMPFACYPRYHRPVPKNPELECDACLLGHAREDRVPYIQELKKHFQVNVYGAGWEQFGIESLGTKNGQAFLEAACSAKVCLNFPKTMAGFTNVKVGIFETIGSGAVTMTSHFDEMAQFFEYEQEIIGYDDVDSMAKQLGSYLQEPQRLEQLRARGFRRCHEEHNWTNRWLSAFEALAQDKDFAERMPLQWVQEAKSTLRYQPDPWDHESQRLWKRGARTS